MIYKGDPNTDCTHRDRGALDFRRATNAGKPINASEHRPGRREMGLAPFENLWHLPAGQRAAIRTSTSTCVRILFWSLFNYAGSQSGKNRVCATTTVTEASIYRSTFSSASHAQGRNWRRLSPVMGVPGLAYGVVDRHSRYNPCIVRLHPPFLILGIGTAFYSIFFYDFGDQEHVFQPVS
jgi:hypothetical protein